MKLRAPCEHGRYEQHQVYVTREIKERTAKAWRDSWNYEDCPGGEFLTDDSLVIPEPIVRPLGTPLTYAGVREVWDALVKPEQEAEIPPSIEMRCLMAILRAVAQGYVDVGQGPIGVR